MAQASSSWQQIIDRVGIGDLTRFKNKFNKQPLPFKSLQRFQGPGGYLGFLAIVTAMWIWNWKLLVASGVGIGTMVFVYSLQEWHWQKFWREIHRFIYSPSRRIVVAVVGGGIATVSSYIATSMWSELDNHWAAAAITIEGMAAVLILILLVWQLASVYGRDAENKFEKILLNLSDRDPLKRLIAIRQIAKLSERIQLDEPTQQYISDCLHLLLTREQEEIVREAAFTSLQKLENATDKSNQPIPLQPLKIKKKQVIKNLG